jgi:hypothetical protein
LRTITASFYDVLGVAPQANPDTIRKAYRRMAAKHHPDVSSDPRAHERMARINEAFQTLADENKRAEYDAMLAAGGLVTTSRRKVRQEPIKVKLRTRLNGHLTPIYALDFAPDSGRLVTIGFDNELIWWDGRSGEPVRRAKLEAGTVSVLRAIAKDRLVAAGSAESNLTLYTLHGPIVDTCRQSQEDWASCVALSADGQTVAAGSIHSSLTVNRIADGTVVYRRKEHQESVTAVAFSANGKYLATGSADATVKLYHAATGALIHTFRQVRSAVTALAFSDDDRLIAVAAVDLSIRIFSLQEGTLKKMVYGHGRPIETLSFHPNGWLLASGSRDGTVGLWNAAKGVGNVRLEVSTRPISCVGFSPDGSLLAAAGQDKIVRLWDVIAGPAEG